MRTKYYLLGASVAIVTAIAIYKLFFNQQSDLEKFIAINNKTIATTQASGDVTSVFPHKQHFCPNLTELTKKDLTWTTIDEKWQNYTPSSANKIITFTGAQWIGIKVGKIICLYQTDEAVNFPLALEQTRSQIILEPSGDGWSALINNHKLCKSANPADCPYTIEPPKDTGNIYEEIKYNPLKK